MLPDDLADDAAGLEDTPPQSAHWPVSDRWRTITVPPLPESGTGAAMIRLAPGELWCADCGGDGTAAVASGKYATQANSRPHCVRCGSDHVVLASAVLRSAEFALS